MKARAGASSPSACRAVPDYINRRRRRFGQERVAALYARHRGSEPVDDAAPTEARVRLYKRGQRRPRKLAFRQCVAKPNARSSGVGSGIVCCAMLEAAVKHSSTAW